MTKRLVGAIGTILILILASSCVSTGQKKPELTAKWVSNMHRLSAAYLSLLPYVADARAFSAPWNRETIAFNLKEMQAAANAVANDPQPPNADPVIGYTATRFAIEMRQAATAFELKDTQWARYSVARASDYCVNCHTSVTIGAKDFAIPWQVPMADLKPAQKIESLIAMRQYASALNLAHAFVWNKEAAQNETRSYLLTLQRVMAMLIRVNKNIPEARQLAVSVLNNKAAPSYVRKDAGAWFDDIKQWSAEKAPATDRAKFKLARSLVAKSADRPHMPANLVTSLRASGILHQLMQGDGAKRAEVLYQAGLVSQSLREINLGYLDQYYFEACIRAEPHTDVAEECFVQLETSVHDTNLFSDLEPGSLYSIDTRLAELRQLAEVKDTEGPMIWKSRLWNYNIDELGKPEKKPGR